MICGAAVTTGKEKLRDNPNPRARFQAEVSTSSAQPGHEGREGRGGEGTTVSGSFTSSTELPLAASACHVAKRSNDPDRNYFSTLSIELGRSGCQGQRPLDLHVPWFLVQHTSACRNVP